jgi:hypothetical protein
VVPRAESLDYRIELQEPEVGASVVFAFSAEKMVRTELDPRRFLCWLEGRHWLTSLLLTHPSA